MTQADARSYLRQTIRTLADLDVIPTATPELDRLRDVALEILRKTVLEEIPEFSASGNPDVLPELAAHAEAHVNEIGRLFSGGIVGDFEFIRKHATRRAEQRFPLEATLHAYRCGHKVLSRWMRNAAAVTAKENLQKVISAVADFAIEYTNTISTIATSEYVAQTRRLAEAEGDRRTELMNVLLRGFDESDGRITRLLRRAGYLEQRQSYCIVVAQPVDPTEMENPARAQRLVKSVADVVAALPVRMLIGVRENVVVAVFSETRRMSGWTVAKTTLAARVHPALLRIGPAALVGISTDKPSTSHIPNALDEARLALDFASVTDRVVRYSDIPIRPILLRAVKSQKGVALPSWTDDFVAANEKSKGSLAATLRAYADADMNVLKAAKSLSIHPNTIYSRVQRINDLTGQSAFSFHELNELLLAIDCRDQLN